MVAFLVHVRRSSTSSAGRNLKPRCTPVIAGIFYLRMTTVLSFPTWSAVELPIRSCSLLQAGGPTVLWLMNPGGRAQLLHRHASRVCYLPLQDLSDRISFPIDRDCSALAVSGGSTNPPMSQLHTEVIAGNMVSGNSYITLRSRLTDLTR